MERVVLVAFAVAAIAMAAVDGQAGEETCTVERSDCVRDARLGGSDAVFGVVIGAEPRAYALLDLAASPEVVHDVVGESDVDIGIEAGEARVLRSPEPVTEARQTSWASWIRSHPDSSLWRPPIVAETERTRPATDVRVVETHHYRTSFGCAVVNSKMTSPSMDAPGLMVIAGSIENVAASPVHHVVIRYELLDADGKVVYRDEAYNRSAEPLAAPAMKGDPEIVPIPPGGSDTMRMIFLSDELPPFETTRVTVARVY